MVGHEKSNCPKKSEEETSIAVVVEGSSGVEGQTVSRTDTGEEREGNSGKENFERGKKVLNEENEEYGPWMVVQRPRGKKGAKKDSTSSGGMENGPKENAATTGTKFAILQEKDADTTIEDPNSNQNIPNNHEPNTDALNGAPKNKPSQSVKSNRNQSTKTQENNPIRNQHATTTSQNKEKVVKPGSTIGPNRIPSNHNKQFTTQTQLENQLQDTVSNHPQNWTTTMHHSQEESQQGTYIQTTPLEDFEMHEPTEPEPPDINSISEEVMIEAVRIHEESILNQQHNETFTHEEENLDMEEETFDIKAGQGNRDTLMGENDQTSQ
ncbi:hypothetical protein AAHE18_12G155600 [Arachis hypogaea]|nr:uncharacterized protein DS421_12g375420 [Arachis hypogaea]